MTSTFFLGVLVGAGVTLAVLGGFWIVWPWIRALLSGASVPFFYFLAMRLRGTPVALVVDAFVTLRKRGRDVPLELVEATYLAERGAIQSDGDPARCVEVALSEREAAVARQDHADRPT